MKKLNLIILILFVLTIGIIMGSLIMAFAENKLMEDYDLYNCIYNNADWNNFNKNPVMIKKIEDECICFREHNYTDYIGKC